jgi:hypothetical protein
MPKDFKIIVSLVLIPIFFLLLTACGTSTPSLGLTPNKQIVQKALLVQISQTQQQLTQNLQASPPKFEITQLVFQQLEPLFIGNLPAYHFRGTYNIEIELPKQKVTQKKNKFDIYLQRQKEGKTWRLAIPQNIHKAIPNSFKTYNIS